jgi:hypothetical protein
MLQATHAGLGALVVLLLPCGLHLFGLFACLDFFFSPFIYWVLSFNRVWQGFQQLLKIFCGIGIIG